MQKILFTFLTLIFISSSLFAVNQQNWRNKIQSEVEGITPEMIHGLDLEGFLSLTPKKYKARTGNKLGIKKTLQLKAAQKFVKNNLNGSEDASADVPKGLYIVAVIFGWGFLVMGLMDDWSGNNWWVNLLLSFLCLIPGIIHGLVKMNDYY